MINFTDKLAKIAQDIQLMLSESELGILILILIMISASSLWLAFQFLKIPWIMLRNKHVAGKARIFTTSESGSLVPNKRILIAGDSTAFGAGAEKPEDSIAGRFGRDFPKAQIINVAKNAAITANILKQLKEASGNFDMIIISVGGNDIWRHTSLRSLEKNLIRVIDTAKPMCGGKVILMFYGCLAYSPALPSLVRWMLRRRTEKVQNIFFRTAEEKKISCLGLYAEAENNLFVTNPEKYLARDKIHPSSEGYKIWYNKLWLEMTQRGYSF